MKKYKYDELMIEITRKFNLQCEHCLRGDSQNITMSKDVIDRIFEDAADCKQILLTGGEPLLALDEIEYFVDRILKSDWTTSNLAMTVNGTIRDKRLIDIANKFCKSKEGRTFYIFISDDEFHDRKELKQALEFYQKFNWADGVIVASQIFAIEDKQKEFTLAGRAIDYYKNHPQLDKKWVVKKEEQTNHRLCIMNDRIPCAMYITAYSDFESIDRLSYGSILQSSMSELIDKHNNACLVSCHDVFLINYYRNLPNPNDPLSEIISRVRVHIFDRFIAAREKAKELYPFVTAHDIMIAIPFPDFIIDQKFESEIISKSENLTDDEIMQYADSDLVNSLSSFNNETENNAFKEFLNILALIKKPNAVIAPDKVYGTGNLEKTPEFRKLAALNHQYQIGKLMPDNSINFRCEAVYGKSFRDVEVEKIQNSDLPDELKLLSLRKDELESKLISEIAKFVTNFTKDFKDELQRIIKNPYDSPINQLRADIQDTINGLKAIRNHMVLLKGGKKH